MGEIADSIIENYIWGASHLPRSRRKTYQTGAGNYKWRTSSGIVDMRDMSIDHIKNAIGICQKTGNWGKEEQLRDVLNEKLAVSNSQLNLDDPDHLLFLFREFYNFYVTQTKLGASHHHELWQHIATRLENVGLNNRQLTEDEYKLITKPYYNCVDSEK